MRRAALWITCALAACGEDLPVVDHVAVVDEDVGVDVVGVGVVDDDGAPAPAGLLGPPYPVVLVHGFSGWTDLGPVDYFYGVKEALEADGVDVTTPALPPYDASVDRADVLAAVVDSVLARTHKRKVHLIAHSQGGLDSRVLITDLGYADRVASLTTISTPHRGTAVADLAEYVDDGVINAAGRLLGWILGSLEGEPSTDEEWRDDDNIAAAYDPNLVASVEGMRPAAMAAFNDAHPDPVGVPIFSVAGVSNLIALDHPYCSDSIWPIDLDARDAVDPFFAAPGAILSLSDGGTVFSPTPNDGLVTIESARWGVFLGCIPADHPDEIGQIADRPSSIFNHITFYRDLVAHCRTLERNEAP